MRIGVINSAHLTSPIGLWMHKEIVVVGLLMAIAYFTQQIKNTQK
jgi:hypothetical protein